MSSNSNKKKYIWLNTNRFRNVKPELNDINYNYVDVISFNIIDNLTKFKNKELSNSELTTRLLSNLSIILTQEKKYQKKLSEKNKNQKQKTSLVKKTYLNKYDIVIPTNRITCLQTITRITKNKIKNYLQVPINQKNIKAFLSSGREFKDPNSANISNKCFTTSQTDNESSFNASSMDLILQQKLSSKSLHMKNNNSSKNEESEEEYSLVNHSYNKENMEDNLFISFNTNNIPLFENYEGLNDYIECPLIKKESLDKKYNDFINIFNGIDNIIDSFDDNILNNEIVDNNISKTNIDKHDNYYYNQIIVDNFYINNYYQNRYNGKNSNNTSSSNCYSPVKIHNKNDVNKSNNINNNNKKKEILTKKIKDKYLENMNEEYIKLLYRKYMKMISRCDKVKSYFIDDVMTKKLFLQFFKKFLLEIGISPKKNYEKILKNQIFNNKLLSFEQFIQCFDSILNEDDSTGYKIKYTFLLNLLPHENGDDFLNRRKMTTFFELISCELVFIQDFYETLIDRLILRYNALYNKDEESNIIEGKYRFRKMRIILESFFDELKFED